MAAQRVDTRGTRAHMRASTAFLRIPREDWGSGAGEGGGRGHP